MEQHSPEKILHYALKVAEQAEVFSTSSRQTSIHFEANKLKQVQTKEISSVALRIFKDGRIGFAQASGIQDIEILVNMAVETSQFGLPANFQLPSSRNYPQVRTFDPQVDEIAMGKMLDLGHQLIAKVTDYAPEILCDARVTKGTASIHILNSQGGEVSYDKSPFGISMEGVMIQDTDMLFVGDSEGSCRSLADVDSLADSVIRQLEWAKEKATVPTKSLPVIFTPTGVASAFLAPLAIAFNGKTVLEGVSPLKNRLGERLFDSELSLWDDATIAYSLASSPCDDEGVSSQQLPLIAGGVVSNFLYDLYTAALAGTQSTGHGRRAGSSFPRPTISSLIIDEGDVSFHSMVEDIKEGLIVEQLIGAEQGNLLSGDFSGNVLLGYKVENGKIVGRVKDTMVSGNVYQVLKEFLGIGNKARWVEGILYTPALYCPRISITTKD